LKRYYQFSDINKYDGNFYDIIEELYYKESRFQKISVLKSYSHGLILTLDDIVQFTEKDEFFYHEMMSHPVMCIHPEPKDILIVGGGDLAILSHILKYENIKSATLCEIDEEVVEMTKRFFPDFAKSLKDNRAKIIIDDGFKFLANQKNKYDIVIVDSTDPETIANDLFVTDFYESAFNSLKDDGIFIAQSESPLLSCYKSIRKSIYKNLKSLFNFVNFIYYPMPCYPTGYFSSVIASKKYNPDEVTKDDINKKIKDFKLKYFNEDIYFSSLTIPNFEKEITNINDYN